MRLLLVSTLLAASSTAHARKIAILLNGGHTEYENTEDSFEDIEKMDQKLKGWDRFILSADGPSRLPKNLKASNSLKTKDGQTEFDQRGFPKLTRRDPKVEGNFVEAATRKGLEKVLKEQVKAGDTVLLYFTDHGDRGKNEGESKIAFWKEMVSTPELKKIIDESIPKSARVILHNEQCFGGGMLNSLREANGRLRSNSCGFAVASEHEFAEAKHSFAKSLEKDKRSNSAEPQATDFGKLFDEHRRINTTSTGVTFSDFFLQEYLQKHSNGHVHGSVVDSLSCKNKAASTDNSKLHNNSVSIQMPVLLDESLRKIRALGNSLCGYQILEGHELNLTSDVTPIIGTVADRISKEGGERAKDRAEVQHLKPLYKAAFDNWMKTEKEPALYLKIKNLSARTDSLNGMLSDLGVKGKDKLVAERELESVKPQFEKSMEQYNLYLRALKGNSTKLVSEFAAFTARTGTENGDPYSKSIINKYQFAKNKMEKGGARLNACQTLQHALVRFKALKMIKDKNDHSSLEEFLDIQRCENTLL
ncbi:MAG: hypothetical protein ABIQ95_05175 [Bdellovibrionia bacterium]